ncbi:alpha/beta hydrolase family protein [Pedobacter jejuensis]|uniref:alpha/beta hydrolase family protein n=1 Tax=Pedobacter jejuensis TaxID=1268550 RepID=UPI001FC90B56|nr:prolyl oligopeptidase family serine peptidase [Pedobacter jejuensis]
MKNLLGSDPSQELKHYFSADKNVNKNTPPTFLVHAKDDKSVPVENSVMLSNVLKANKVKTEMFLYEKGGHGFGLINPTSDVDWFSLLASWMKKEKL